jgi:excinuclease UvrABC ATPase subunit
LVRQQEYMGGEVVFAGPYKDIFTTAADSLTTKYMNGSMEIPVPLVRRKSSNFIEIIGARQHNLKKIDVRIPLNALTVVTGGFGFRKNDFSQKYSLSGAQERTGRKLCFFPWTV